MIAALKNIRQTLSGQLIAIIILVVLGTTVATGAPAYWLAHKQMRRQAWDQLTNGAQVTQTLLASEQSRLSDLVALTSQRPTLQQLIVEYDPDDLDEYLNMLRVSVALDLLAVYDSSGILLVSNPPVPILSDLLPVTDSHYAVLTGDEAGLAMLATRPVTGANTGHIIGYVTAGHWLDADFVQNLAAETGLEQSIILGGRRSATSIENLDDPVQSDLLQRVERSGTVETAPLTAGASRYYTALFPLDPPGVSSALVEVALPIDAIIAAETQVALSLILSTLLIALIGSLVGALFAQRLTIPLDQLTTAAQTISGGDFSSAVPVAERPVEIATLGAALEQSRINTHQALTDLSHSKEWSDMLIQSVIEGIMTIDRSGHIQFFSQGAERISGWKQDEVIAYQVDDIFHLAEDDMPFSQQIPRPGEHKRLSVILAEGRIATLALTGAALALTGAGEASTILVFRDISEEDAVHRLLGSFLGSIAHEFKTPLSALAASIELLQDQTPDLSAAELNDLLTSLHLGIVGLQTLVDNLLESANIEARRFQVSPRACHLEQIVAEAASLLNPLFIKHEQRLVIDLPPDLPIVFADCRRTLQVLVNLLSNAIKYSPNNTDITISTVQMDKYLRVMVADRGPGISLIERPDIFRRFVRHGVSSDNNRKGGAGLGLSVVKAIAEAQGGHVGVDGQIGGGSVFWFTLPLAGT
nr:PAS domain S-box protein [Anaerolineae bacterium]